MENQENQIQDADITELAEPEPYWDLSIGFRVQGKTEEAAKAELEQFFADMGFTDVRVEMTKETNDDDWTGI